MRLPSTDEVELTVHDLGGSGQPALLCHATGFHGQIWAPLAARLHGLHCWAPDLRGHGTSPAPADHDFAWSGFADDVLACVDGLSLAGAVGIGHSKGGAALLLAEQRRPGTFRGLWLYEPVVMPPMPPGPGFGNGLADGARRRRSTFESVAAAIEQYSSKPPMARFDPEILRAYVAHGFEPQADGTIALRCTPEDEARVYEMGGQHDADGHLGEVTCPVLVVRGGAVTQPGPARFADGIAERLGLGRLEVHEDLDHFGPMTDPAGLADSIDAFVAGLDG